MAPAHAGSISVTDAAGDTADPVLYTSNLQKPKPTNPSPSSDILSYSLASTTIGGAPALQATFVVKGPIPAQGSTNAADYQGPTYQGQKPFIGGSYYGLYQDPRTETGANLPGSGCDRVGGHVRDQQGNYQDGFRDYVGLSVEFDGTKWNHTPQIGWYDPKPNGGFTFIDLKNDASMAGKWSESVVNNGSSWTITITSATKVTTTDAECTGPQPGLFVQDFGTTGDNIINSSALSTNNTTVVLPTTVPATPATDSITAVGGFVYFSDWTNTNTSPSVETFDPGLTGQYENLAAGPGCATPTFGGTLPDNPLWSVPTLPPPAPNFRPGQPCEVKNPVGAAFINSAYNFIY